MNHGASGPDKHLQYCPSNQPQNDHLSEVHETSSKMDHILGYNARLTAHIGNEIISCILSYHNRLEQN
jgi:hypothetical protein